MKSARFHRGYPAVLAYGLPALALAMPTIPVFVLLPSFYAERMGLGLAVVGGVLLAVRLLDMLTDPLIGWLSDRLPVATGRRKWPIAVGALLAGPGLLQLYAPPAGIGAGYLFLWATLLFLGWTLIQIPYLAWATELEPRYGARNRWTASREGFGLLGILGAGALMYLLSGTGEAARLDLLAQITVAVGAVTMTLALLRLPDRRPARAANPSAWRDLKNNRLFLRLLGAWFVNGLANGFPAVCFPLYVQYVLGAEETIRNGFLLLYFLCAVAAIPLWLPLARRFGKHRTWCTAMIMAIVAFALVPFLTAGDLLLYGLVCVVTGAALAADLALPPSMQADLADWDRLRFGAERTGLLFSFWNMSVKLSLALAVGIAFPLLAWAGLEEGTPGPGAITVLLMIYALLPLVLKTLAVAMMWHFPIGRRQHQAIRRGLVRRQAAMGRGM